MSFAAYALRDVSDAPQPFGRDDLIILNKLRLLAARAQCASRIDAFKACSLLSAERTVAAAGYAEALLRLASQTFGRAPVLYQPGAHEVSADEAILLRLVTSARDADEDSLRFLSGRFLSREISRPMIFLCRNLAKRLETF